MASVKRFRSSKKFYACFRGVDGRRKQVSTDVDDREKALALAHAYERAANDARSNQFAEDRAQRFLTEVRAITGASAIESVQADDWLTSWAQKTKHRMRGKSATKYIGVVASFVLSLGADSKASLAHIRPRHVAEWRDGLLHQGRTKKTVNVALGILSQAFVEAIAVNLSPCNPCGGLKLRGAAVGNVRRLPFSQAQVNAMLEVVDAEWCDYLLCLALAGARQQEAAQLLWEQVDFSAGTIRIIRGKLRDKPHVVPMHPALRSRMEAAFENASSVRVFPTISQMRGQAVSKKFREQILPKIGIYQAYGGRPGGKVPAQYTLHSLRHSLSSWADEVGMTAAQRRDLVGHDSTQVNERYTHANLDMLRANLSKIQIAAPARSPAIRAASVAH